MKKVSKPKIGLTLGDFNGVGPEIILKTLTNTTVLDNAIPILYGSSTIIDAYRKLLNIPVNFEIIDAATNAFPKKNNLIEVIEGFDQLPEPGKVTAEAGSMARIALFKAAEDLKSGAIDAVVTAPINKHNIQSEEFTFPGHTEYFSQLANNQDNLMLMVGDKLRIGVFTGHVPLKEVPSLLTKELIVSKTRILHAALQNDFGITAPRIAIMGLNPHAGEEGLLGNEEIKVIIPAIELLNKEGIHAIGPFAADGFFGAGMQNQFDGVMATYHDQGLAPFKALAFDSGVNYTAGMPFIRTSPDHGTAYTIAGKNIANTHSYRHALQLAIDIVKRGLK